MILHLAKDLVTRLGPQVVDLVKRLVEALDGYPLDHDALEHEGSAQHATQGGLKQRVAF